MKYYLFALFFSVVGLFSPFAVCAEDQKAPDGAKVLEKIMGASGNLNFKGTSIHILVGKDGVPVVKKYSVGQENGKFTRKEIVGGSTPGQINIQNNKGSWVFHNKDGRMHKVGEGSQNGKPPLNKQERRLKRIQANYEVKFIEKNNIAGRTCAIYSFLPREKGRLAREFWVDTASGLPLRVDTFSPDGRLLNISSFENIELTPIFHPNYLQPDFLSQVRQVSQAEMDEAARAHHQRIKETAPEGIQFPAYIPRGYWLKNILLQIKNQETRYQLIYTDGIVPLSIFQEKISRGAYIEGAKGMQMVSFGTENKGYFKQQGVVKILCFQIEDAKNTIVGEIGKNEMQKIAESFLTQKEVP